MVRLAVAKPLALVCGLIVHRLARIMRDVHDPIREPLELLGDAWPAAQVGAVRLRLAVRLHRLVDRAVAGVLAGTAAPAADQQDQWKKGK